MLSRLQYMYVGPMLCNYRDYLSKLIVRLCEVFQKKRSTEKAHCNSYFTVYRKAQPFPKVKLSSTCSSRLSQLSIGLPL